MLKNWQRLLIDKKFKTKLFIRENVIFAIRNFFTNEGFHEVETPLLVKSPGTEPELEVFATEIKHLSGQTESAYLLTSPEYFMKKLLAAGLGSIFQICKSFRNEESLGGSHNPEFTILEWYRTPANYLDVMNDCENLLVYLSKTLQPNHNLKLTFQGQNYNLAAPYPRFTVSELFKKYLNLSQEALLDQASLLSVAQEKNFQVSKETSWDELFYQLFLNYIEPELAKFKQPVFVYDYPSQQAALSKKKASDPRFAERFELYLAGLELGNAFSELTDAEEQEKRLRQELELRARKGKIKYELDEDFIDALKSGLPETGGIAVGVDRLVMLFADEAEINQTLFFPANEIFNAQH